MAFHRDSHRETTVVRFDYVTESPPMPLLSRQTEKQNEKNRLCPGPSPILRHERRPAVDSFVLALLEHNTTITLSWKRTCTQTRRQRGHCGRLWYVYAEYGSVVSATAQLRVWRMPQTRRDVTETLYTRHWRFKNSQDTRPWPWSTAESVRHEKYCFLQAHYRHGLSCSPRERRSDYTTRPISMWAPRK